MIGGSLAVSERVEAAVALYLDGGGARLGAAILARGWPGWGRGESGGPIPRTVPRTPGDQPPLLGGARVDTLALLYDWPNDVAWVGGRRVPLRGHNVVLVDHADGTGGPLTIRTLRVDPVVALPGRACERVASAEEAQARDRAILTALRRSEEVRTFLDR